MARQHLETLPGHAGALINAFTVKQRSLPVNRLLTRGLPALLLALLLSACQTTTYEFVVPASDAGKLCVTQCAGIREQCRGNEMQRAQSDKAFCERNAESGYRACLATAASNKTDPGKCHRQSCYASENHYRCESEYQQCFVNCGGQVIPHTTK